MTSFCMDYRKLNSITADAYPMPRVELLDKLVASNYLTIVDH